MLWGQISGQKPLKILIIQREKYIGHIPSSCHLWYTGIVESWKHFKKAPKQRRYKNNWLFYIKNTHFEEDTIILHNYIQAGSKMRQQSRGSAQGQVRTVPGQFTIWLPSVFTKKEPKIEKIFRTLLAISGHFFFCVYNDIYPK